MIISPVFLKQHRFTILSTAALLTAGLPVLFVSPASYGMLSGVTLLRGLLLGGAVAHSATKHREECVAHILESDVLRKALASQVVRVCTN